MANEIEIKVPDIGDASAVDVIEIQVSAGDRISVDDSIITLESDKASMEIPSTAEGIVKTIQVKLGDKVSQGDLILTLESSDESQTTSKKEAPQPSQSPSSAATESPTPIAASPSSIVSKPQVSNVEAVLIPDIGDASDVDVIEILVAVGDSVKADDSLITLEGDKATMDVPAPFAGRVESIEVSIGDKVSQGDKILNLSTHHQAASEEAPATPQDTSSSQAQPQIEQTTVAEDTKKVAPSADVQSSASSTGVHAGPAVRRMARELGVPLQEVKGTANKGRISKKDLQAFVKSKMQAQSSVGFGLPKAPSIDFSKFGSTELKPLNKIKRITAQNMHRSWISVPHVTQFEEADITELEAFRKQYKDKAQAKGYKLTPLAFITKAVASALQHFPQFNASLDDKGENLIIKHYVNIGIAVDTPNGLVVPVIKGVDGMSVYQIAAEMAHLSQKAREKGLMPGDMSGGCFTISSLGGIGGTAFTPIVNHPEVAILGVSRSQVKPVFKNEKFEPRLMLPLSLSYDHRVIDGAEAARFTSYLNESLTDIRTLLL